MTPGSLVTGLKTIVHVVGARPNYMKIAPVIGRPSAASRGSARCS